MKNFLVLVVLFFAVLIFSVQAAYAQCPTLASVTLQAHTDISCFGANDGTITVDLADASTSIPYNFDLFDVNTGLPLIPGFDVTEVEDKTAKSVVYSDIPPGLYRVVFFKSGCPSLVIQDPPFGFEITQPIELLANVDDVDPDCNATVGVGNGQIDISASGGTGPYTIVWSGPTAVPNGTLSTTATLDAGNYTITVTDANSCEVILNAVVPVTTPANAGPATGQACGTNSFALSGNAFAAGEIGTWTGPAGVTFSPNANTPNATANNLNVGNNVLTWTITDAGFVCAGSSDFITVTYSDVNISGSADVVLPCFGATTGSGTFTVTGGVAPFTYSVVSNTSGATVVLPAPGPTTSVNFSNGGAGVVTLQVLDNTGCTDQVTINITQPASAVTITRSPGATITLACNGDTNGSGSFTASGGTGAHTFTVTTNTTGGTTSIVGSVLSFSGAGAGTISVEARDANNCLQSSSITISAPSALTLTPSSPTITLLCNGDTNGSGNFTAAGGTGAHTFTVTGNTTGGTTSIVGSVLSFSGAGPGTITVQVRDANNCLQSSSITISAPPALTLTPSAPTVTLLCNGDTNGSGSFTAAGGTGAHTFTVTGNTTGGTTSIVGSVLSFSGAGAGIISVQVRDVNNCLQASSITISAPPALTLTPSAPTIALLCNGDTNGSGSFTAAGGTGAHTFTVTANTTGGTTSIVGSVISFSGAGAGTISVDVRDANNCLQSSSITITTPTVLVLTPSAPTITLLCNGDTNGSGTFTAAGGTGTHTFTVTGNTTGGATSIVGSVLSFSGAGPGTISVEVRDANNCLQASSITISAPSALTLTPSAPTITLLCNGDTNGSGNFTAAGGTGAHTFTVTGNTTGATTSIAGSVLSFSGAGTGTISIEVRDANNCLQASSITITAPPLLVISNPGDVTLTCTGGNNAAGTFTAGGGTTPYTFTILQNTTGATTSSTATDFSYANGGGGVIEIQVQDGNGCTQTQLVTVTPVVVITVTAGSTSATCSGVNDGTITITGTTGGSGSYEYSLDGGSFSASLTYPNLAPGDHIIVARDGLGCTSSPITVTVGSGLVYDVSASSTPASCGGVNDGTVTVTSTTGGVAPFQYSIDGGALQASTTFINQGVGNHSVTAVDANGCVSNPFDIVVGSGVTITSTNTPSAVTVCLGSDGSIDISGITGGTSPYDLSIDNGSTFPVTDVTANTFTGLVAGSYTVVIRDNAGCLSTPTLVTVAAPPGCVLNCFAFNVVTDMALTTRPTCNGGGDGVIALTISGPPGNYIVSLIPSAAPPVILPSGSTFIFSNLSEDNYQYQISDGTNICIQSFAWDAVANVQATVVSSQDSPCFGVPAGSAVIDATGSSTGQYFFSVDGTAWTEFVPGNLVTGLPGLGTYNIRVGGSVNDPCFDVVSVTINELGTAPLDTVYVSPVNGFPAVSYPESPTATRVIGIEESGAAPYEVRLELVDPYGITPNPPFIVDWTVVDETNPQSFIPQKQLDALYAGEYVLSLRDAIGCERTFSFIIELDDRIFIPNVFTPNKSDDLNSTFFVRNLPESGSRLSVSDRWGKEVYASNNYNPGTLWDGGETPDGVYFYRLQIKGGKTYTGWIEILRGTKP